jgi:hypothetical protein
MEKAVADISVISGDRFQTKGVEIWISERAMIKLAIKGTIVNGSIYTSKIEDNIPI